MTDCELVRRMQQGDMQAFDTLYERYKDDAYRLACLITGSRTDGDSDFSSDKSDGGKTEDNSNSKEDEDDN